MAATYDTALIREAARQVQAVSDRLDDNVVHQLKRAQASMEGWKGQAADALTEQLIAQQRDICSDLQRLLDVAAKLRAYANALDNADRQLAEIMRGRG